MATGLTPVTRREMYLSAAAGETETSALPTPVTREEIYLNKIANGSGGGGGTSDYSDLSNKPQINSTELSGNKTSSDLGLQSETLGSWTAGTATTHSIPASTDTVLQALEKIDNNQRNDETNISSVTDHIKFDSTSKTYYLQQTQPSSPVDGDIWIG